jgi:hypothetical protein
MEVGIGWRNHRGELGVQADVSRKRERQRATGGMGGGARRSERGCQASSRGAGNDGSKTSSGRALEPENEVSLGGIATKEGRGRREELKDGSIGEGNSRGHIGEEGDGLRVKRGVAREKSQKRVAIVRRTTNPLKVVEDGINDAREELLGTPTTVEDALVGIAR